VAFHGPLSCGFVALGRNSPMVEKQSSAMWVRKEPLGTHSVKNDVLF